MALTKPIGSVAALGSPVTPENGGTGTTTLTGLVKGNGTSTMTAAAAGTDYGYATCPQNSQSADYGCVLTDNGGHVYHPVGDANPRTFTIPANGTVAFPIGSVLSFINMSASAVTIAITTDTLTWVTGGASGSRTLAQYGSATAIKITSTQWLISGVNLT